MMATLPCCANEVNRWQRLQGAGRRAHLKYAISFMLLAAACFARGSTKFHDWLLAHPLFGPMIVEWQEYGSIPWRTKIVAIALMSTTLGVSIVFFVEPRWLKAALTVLGLVLATWLYRVPSRDRP